jgi:uncharacterized protein YndB with AHSA1/START domain
MERAELEQDRPRLSIVRTYPVAPEKVWRAWTDPQALARWFGPGEANSVTRADIDLRVGGRYHIVFHTPDCEDHDVSGVYQEVVLHRRLVFSWAWKSTPERVSRVSLDLRAVDGGTELSFLHDRFFDREARNNHERGWGGSFAKLDAFLAA